ncbi:MAG: 16S rRNA (cytidine(1402)-2'-O)-methyltransferase [Gammaproteobacteria bacterium]|nr:16S rRNA (cytidine(1402)-2'-O)-methyltransferase [Gammaproteobacteria bacterium]
MLGTLYIVATPIGNLQDMTFRAIEVLKNSDYILAESSARTSKLLSEFNIKKRIITFNKDNEKRKKNSVIQDLSEGMNICLVSDAGTPSVSDPGFELMKYIDLSFRVVPIPGASSLTAALSVSKIPINDFIFLGFLSKKSSERKMQLLKIKKVSMPGVIFESKHRVVSVLADVTDVLGGDTNIGIMRELTKIHEEIFFGTANELILKFANQQLTGEITMIIGTSSVEQLNIETMEKEILELSKKYSTSEVVNIIRLFNDVNKKELYKYVLNIRQEG